MVRENIMFFENDDKSCFVIDLYLNHNIIFGYKDSYNYCDIDVDKILPFKKSDNEHIIRYNDVNKMTIAPLQLKIFIMNYIDLQTIIEQFLLIMMKKKFLEDVEKYGITLLN